MNIEKGGLNFKKLSDSVLDFTKKDFFHELIINNQYSLLIEDINNGLFSDISDIEKDNSELNDFFQDLKKSFDSKDSEEFKTRIDLYFWENPLYEIYSLKLRELKGESIAWVNLNNFQETNFDVKTENEVIQWQEGVSEKLVLVTWWITKKMWDALSLMLWLFDKNKEVADSSSNVNELLNSALEETSKSSSALKSILEQNWKEWFDNLDLWISYNEALNVVHSSDELQKEILSSSSDILNKNDIEEWLDSTISHILWTFNPKNEINSLKEQIIKLREYYNLQEEFEEKRIKNISEMTKLIWSSVVFNWVSSFAKIFYSQSPEDDLSEEILKQSFEKIAQINWVNINADEFFEKYKDIILASFIKNYNDKTVWILSELEVIKNDSEKLLKESESADDFISGFFWNIQESTNNNIVFLTNKEETLEEPIKELTEEKTVEEWELVDPTIVIKNFKKED